MQGCWYRERPSFVAFVKLVAGPGPGIEGRLRLEAREQKRVCPCRDARSRVDGRDLSDGFPVRGYDIGRVILADAAEQLREAPVRIGRGNGLVHLPSPKVVILPTIAYKRPQNNDVAPSARGGSNRCSARTACRARR